MNSLRKSTAPVYMPRLKQISIAIVALVFFGLTQDAFAQQDELRKRFDDSVAKLRTALKETKRTGALYFHSRAAESDKWREEWLAAGRKGIEAESEMQKTAKEILFHLADPPEDIVSVSLFYFRELYSNCQYEKAYELISRLVELDRDDSELAVMKVRAAAKTNRYDEVQQFKDENAELLAEIPQEELPLFNQLDKIKGDFDKELEIRAAETAADDLPRVELTTNKGKIVIELFENEAPDTVGNFVSLVESGFYDGVLFHRVMKDFMAQAGGYSLRGPQVVNYSIYDEFNREDFRRHFRGTVSMAKLAQFENSGSAQFFILTSTRPHLDGRHTAFGRVISGMDVVDSLIVTFAKNEDGEEKPIETVTPDGILSAKVLRKRDHEYKPNRVRK